MNELYVSESQLLPTRSHDHLTTTLLAETVNTVCVCVCVCVCVRACVRACVRTREHFAFWGGPEVPLETFRKIQLVCTLRLASDVSMQTQRNSYMIFVVVKYAKCEEINLP